MAYRDIEPKEFWSAYVEGHSAYGLVDASGRTPPGKQQWLVRRVLDDGRVLYLYPIIGGVSLGVSANEVDNGYRVVYDFSPEPFVIDGWRAALQWDGEGEPEGWTRLSRLGEPNRHRPDGSAASEGQRGDGEAARAVIAAPVVEVSRSECACGWRLPRSVLSRPLTDWEGEQHVAAYVTLFCPVCDGRHWFFREEPESMSVALVIAEHQRKKTAGS